MGIVDSIKNIFKPKTPTPPTIASPAKPGTEIKNPKPQPIVVEQSKVTNSSKLASNVNVVSSSGKVVSTGSSRSSSSGKSSSSQVTSSMKTMTQSPETKGTLTGYNPATGVQEGVQKSLAPTNRSSISSQLTSTEHLTNQQLTSGKISQFSPPTKEQFISQGKESGLPFSAKDYFNMGDFPSFFRKGVGEPISKLFRLGDSSNKVVQPGIIMPGTMITETNMKTGKVEFKPQMIVPQLTMGDVAYQKAQERGFKPADVIAYEGMQQIESATLPKYQSRVTEGTTAEELEKINLEYQADVNQQFLSGSAYDKARQASKDIAEQQKIFEPRGAGAIGTVANIGARIIPVTAIGIGTAETNFGIGKIASGDIKGGLIQTGVGVATFTGGAYSGIRSAGLAVEKQQVADLTTFGSKTDVGRRYLSDGKIIDFSKNINTKPFGTASQTTKAVTILDTNAKTFGTSSKIVTQFNIPETFWRMKPHSGGSIVTGQTSGSYLEVGNNLILSSGKSSTKTFLESGTYGSKSVTNIYFKPQEVSQGEVGGLGMEKTILGSKYNIAVSGKASGERILKGQIGKEGLIDAYSYSPALNINAERASILKIMQGTSSEGGASFIKGVGTKTVSKSVLESFPQQTSVISKVGLDSATKLSSKMAFSSSIIPKSYAGFGAVKTTQATTTKLAPTVTSKLKPVTLQVQESFPGLISVNPPVVTPRTGGRTSTRIASITPTIVQPIVIPTPSVPIFPGGRFPRVSGGLEVPFELPLFKLPSGDIGGTMGTKTFSGTRKLGYAPDFKSVFFGIKGKQPQVISKRFGYGEQARPLISKPSKVATFFKASDYKIKYNIKKKTKRFFSGFKL